MAMPADITINPLPQTPATAGNPFGANYFLTIGNPLADTSSETKPPAVALTLASPYDPVDYNTGPPTGATAVPAGALPPAIDGTFAAGPYPLKLPSTVPTSTTTPAGTAQYYWVCLRRPANPFEKVSNTNPMIVVDSMRFPYMEAGGTGASGGGGDMVTQGTAQLYSYQRLQPYRGGHAVPAASATGLDSRYGYTEQIAQPLTDSTNFGQYGTTGSQASGSPGPNITISSIYHTLGSPNDGGYSGTTQQEPWDNVPFNDRDFTSVFELTLVPGCPPGLFTKQFAEFAPTLNNVNTIFQNVTPLGTPLLTRPTYHAAATNYFNYNSTANPVQPHTFPYLIDKFFYSGVPLANPATTPSLNDPTADGWFRMLEFFEVPSQMIDAIGPVAQGINLDWMRQDVKPGLINLNLVIDEEVFYSVLGKQDPAFHQLLLNFDQVPDISPNALVTAPFTGGVWPGAQKSGYNPIPIVVTATLADGSPHTAYPLSGTLNNGLLATDPVFNVLSQRLKAAFVQFLTLRHGGSGFLFGYGSGAVGQNFTVLPPGTNPNAPATPNGIPADRPFRSLSFPDINYTILRPAALPPSTYTDPQLPSRPPSPVWPPGPPGSPTGYSGNYIGDPGVRNPSLYQGYAQGFAGPLLPPRYPSSVPATALMVPPTIPSRRLFQIPDAYNPGGGTPGSNASEPGDPYMNNQVPATAGNPSPGALPQVYTTGPGTISLTNNVVNVYWPGTASPANVTNFYFGATNANPPTPILPATPLDNRQTPYFRSEMLQKVMNLTTVRTHQYAVWITVGFFEVKRQGDILMVAAGAGTPAAALAFDILGPEVGASTGQTTRYRGFFVVDRLKLTGFDATTPGSFRPAVVYRQTIE